MRRRILERSDMEKNFKPAYLRKDDMRGEIQVWIVDGSYVHGHIDEG